MMNVDNDPSRKSTADKGNSDDREVIEVERLTGHLGHENIYIGSYVLSGGNLDIIGAYVSVPEFRESLEGLMVGDVVQYRLVRVTGRLREAGLPFRIEALRDTFGRQYFTLL